jgi:hypothetical protein
LPKSKDDSRRRYIDEPLARGAILTRLADRFSFIEEVEAVDEDGNGFRIDAVSRCADTGWTFGWEFKRSHLYMKEFAPALRQAIRYRLARIVDRRLPQLRGSRLRAIALFPDWLGEHDDDGSNYGREAEGMRLLAAQFRVGTMRELAPDRFSFFMGQNAIWHSASGWTKNAEAILFGKRGLGAMRKPD